MEKITVKKEDLITVLNENRAIHKQNYEDSMGGYKMLAEKQLKEKLKKLKATGEFKAHFDNLIEPDSHVKEYDNIIDMLEVASEDTVTLSMEEFLKYYKNEWEWQRSWSLRNDGYATLYNVAGVGKHGKQ